MKNFGFMIGLKISGIKLDFALMITIASVFGTAEQNDNSNDSRMDITDESTVPRVNDYMKKISFTVLKETFSNSANLSNCLWKHENNIFKLDAQEIDEYLKLIVKDVEYFNLLLNIEDLIIKESSDFRFIHKFCLNAIPLIFKSDAKQRKRFANVEDVLKFIDSIPEKFWEKDRSEDEIQKFEILCAESKEIIAQYKKGLNGKLMGKYKFCKSIIHFKKVEYAILNCYIICYYAKIAFSYGFLSLPVSNEFYSNLSASKELLEALLRDKTLSEIQNIKCVIIPRLETEDPNNNAIMVEKVNDLLKRKNNDKIFTSETEELENKSIQELLDMQKALELELTACEEDFKKIEDSKNVFLEKISGFEQGHIKSFNNVLLEFYDLRTNLYSLFTCPNKFVDLEKNLFKKILNLTISLLNYYHKLERNYEYYYKKLEELVIKSNSIKNKLQSIQNVIDKIYLNKNTI